MALTPIFDPAKAACPMRVAAFMSGSGTNILKLIEREKWLKAKDGVSPFEVIFIFSDRADGSCQGERIACENGIPYFSFDIRSFHRLRGLKRSVATPEGISGRKAFDHIPDLLLKAFEIDVVALGGYMSYTTVNRCVNVHPADLSILTPEGRRKYVGDNAVLASIAAGETCLRSSTIWTDKGVDTGPLLIVSAPLKVELPEPLEDLCRNKEKLISAAKEYQQRIKEIGDWIIFPQTIEMIARGRFALDPENRVYVDGHPVPHGYRHK